MSDFAATTEAEKVEEKTVAPTSPAAAAAAAPTPKATAADDADGDGDEDDSRSPVNFGENSFYKCLVTIFSPLPKKCYASYSRKNVMPHLHPLLPLKLSKYAPTKKGKIFSTISKLTYFSI